MLKRLKNKKTRIVVALAALIALFLLLGGMNAHAQSSSWFFIFPPDGNFLNLAS